MGDLISGYTGVVLDLDGVCYRGAAPIPGAAETVSNLRSRGVGVVFATNNATKTTRQVAAHLATVGIDARPEEVVTSAAAAAALLEPGTSCLVVGMAGLREALAQRGCPEVTDPADAEAVVVGLDRGITYGSLERASRGLLAGARFVATNPDPTYPAADGVSPGAGALVAFLSTASNRQPEIAGKPRAPLFRTAAAMLPEGPILMCGDRVETDIAGAAAMGWDTALVLTGVTSRSAVLAARPQPTYVLDDVTGLVAPADASGRVGR